MRASLGVPVNRDLVLDSWPVMEWLKERQPVVDWFDELIRSAGQDKVRLWLSSINLGEIYYNCWTEWNTARAEDTLATLRALPVQVIHPTEQDVLAAARLKGKYNIAYADCFAIVLATEIRCPVVTGDPDFLKVQRGGVLSVEWVGQ